MKKLKQALSLTLALVLSLALAAPAFAAEHTLHPDMFTYEFDLPRVEKDFTLHSDYELPTPRLSNSLNDNCYYVFNKESEFKVSNVSAERIIAIMVYLYMWDGKKYEYSPSSGKYSLQADGSWTAWSESTGGIGESGFLKPGQSITYKMPDAASQKDVLYAVCTYAWNLNGAIPDNGGAYTVEFTSFLLEGSAAPAEPAEPAVTIPEGSVAYTVQKGDTLSAITTNFYGNNAQREALYRANIEAFRATKGALKPGMVLAIPAVLDKAVRLAAPVAGAGEKLYTVKAGDTLGQIAAAEYGNANEYKAIFERNSDRLKDVNTIYEGQVIVLPAKK